MRKALTNPQVPQFTERHREALVAFDNGACAACEFAVACGMALAGWSMGGYPFAGPTHLGAGSGALTDEA